MISPELEDAKALFQRLKTNKSGLSETEAEKRLKEYGKNELKTKREFTAIRIFLGQFTSFLVLILLAAAIISYIIGEHLDAYGIFAIIIINAVIGFLQEYKAENSMKSLKKLVSENTIVVRDGKRELIDSRLLVLGDIVVLEEGMKVPADIKLIEGFSLKADESVLTGESVPSSKKILKHITEENYKDSVLFSNTLIVSGSGLGLVYATGMETEFGRIAELVMEREKEPTQLSLQMNDLAKKLGIIIVILVAIIFGLGTMRGIEFIHMFSIAVSLGVSAIPEGLPIIVTLTLALGVQLIAKRNAIVRKMSVIEALGAATVICSDKTGTLTINEMTAQKVFVSGNEFKIEGVGYDATDPAKIEGHAATKIMEVAKNCNNSYIEFDDYKKASKIIGDPTEICLRVLAKKFGEVKDYPKLDEYAFTSDRKMMSTLNKVDGGKELFLKGAPEEVLKVCTKILIDGRAVKITEEQKKNILKKNGEWAQGAMRVLAFAYKPTSEKRCTEEKMVFLGLVGMIDPPRKEVEGALKIAQRAGIQVKVITGDNPLTAEAVARSIGMKVTGIYEGSQLDQMNDTELKVALKKGNIFARTNPNHKYRIVTILKEMGEVVAVTGDGVNDAPALKKADIGIAMGIKGTQVSKESSDIILQDDNFATIINIIEEGRRVYANILSFVKFLLSANASDIAVVGLITLVGAPLPILPLQILWINIATDSLPALALGAEKAEKGIIEEKPHKKGEGLLKKFALFITLSTIIQIIANVLIFIYGFQLDLAEGINTFDLSAPSYARTMIFTFIVTFELFLVFNCRGIGKSLLKGGLFVNKKLILAVLASFALQFIILYHPFMQEVFKSVPLGPVEWGIILLVATPAFIIPQLVEFLKKFLPKEFAQTQH